jgi:uncharacterized OB-fold protein
MQKIIYDEGIKKLEEFVKESKKILGFPIIPDQKLGTALWVSNRELKINYIISVEKIKKFFEGLSEGKIYATKCLNCNEIYFPPQSECSKCKNEKMEWIELSGEGELLTFTKIFVKPYTFSHYEDYIVGIARLKEGINVTAWVEEKDFEKIKVGSKIKLKVVKRFPEEYLTYVITIID